MEANEIIAVDKIALSQLHELGHAMNKYGKIGKMLQNIRLGCIKNPLVAIVLGGITVAIPLVGIFKNKKAEGEKPQGFFNKTTTFIKNNVGKLSFLTALPLVLEEGLASFKGEKAVKGLISKYLLKKVKISNRLGLAIYVVGATIAGVAAYMTSKIRDKIAQPNLNK